MIAKDKILAMAAMLGMSKTDIAAAYDSAEEQDIELPSDVQVYTAAAIDKMKKEARAAERTAAIEIAVKEYKQQNGLEFEGKSIKALATHLQSMTDTDGKIITLQKNLQAAEQKALDAESRAESVATRYELMSAIPAEYNGLTRNELFAIAETNGIIGKRENGKTVMYRNGSPVRNEKTQDDLSPSEVYRSFFETERKMGAASGEDVKTGRGAKPKVQETMGAYKRSEIEKQYLAANPNANLQGMEYTNYFASKIKEAAAAGQQVEMD